MSRFAYFVVVKSDVQAKPNLCKDSDLWKLSIGVNARNLTRTVQPNQLSLLFPGLVLGQIDASHPCTLFLQPHPCLIWNGFLPSILQVLNICYATLPHCKFFLWTVWANGGRIQSLLRIHPHTPKILNKLNQMCFNFMHFLSDRARYESSVCNGEFEYCNFNLLDFICTNAMRGFDKLQELEKAVKTCPICKVSATSLWSIESLCTMPAKVACKFSSTNLYRSWSGNFVIWGPTNWPAQ